MTPETSPQASRQNDIPAQLEFSRIGTTCVQVVFDEPDLSSDGCAATLGERRYTSKHRAAHDAAVPVPHNP